MMPVRVRVWRGVQGGRMNVSLFQCVDWCICVSEKGGREEAKEGGREGGREGRREGKE